MSIPLIDIKLVWLAEAGMTSNRVIDKLQEKEALGRNLSPTEAEYAKSIDFSEENSHPILHG